MLASMRPARLFTVLYFSATRRNQAHSLTGGYLGFKSTGFSLAKGMFPCGPLDYCQSRGGGGYFLIRGYWGCATGWGRISTTGLTFMGSHFQ